ncbi:MAG TPA: zinc ribbon domain-containing protein, partial [Herpetosiphonaceae bacterium]
MINCPRCGASNPADNRFCGKCGQVLSASGMLDHAPEPAAELPDWLKESAGDAGSSFSGSPSSATPPAPNQSELPAWLSEIGMEDDRQPADSAQAPDWLAQLQQSPPESSSAAELPAWLRSNDEPPIASSAPPAESQQLPD